jgi:2-hydroxychromene-2-carboxylate isomerase
MTTATPQKVDFHFDPMCPFAYQASLWIRTVREQIDIEVDWRFFSLEEVNRVEGKKHPWERQWSYGWSLMRIGALLRRRDMSQLDDWYAAIGAALHRDGLKPHEPEVARELLAKIGLDPSTLDEAIEDPTTHDDVLADHQVVIEAGGFGVPTLVFENGQVLFGPVVREPPTGDRAVRLWEVFTGWLDFPELYEMQRPKSRADLRSIAESLQPYVTGRDWESVNRGKKIDIPKIEIPKIDTNEAK